MCPEFGVIIAVLIVCVQWRIRVKILELLQEQLLPPVCVRRYVSWVRDCRSWKRDSRVALCSQSDVSRTSSSPSCRPCEPKSAPQYGNSLLDHNKSVSIILLYSAVLHSPPSLWSLSAAWLCSVSLLTPLGMCAAVVLCVNITSLRSLQSPPRAAFLPRDIKLWRDVVLVAIFSWISSRAVTSPW